MSETDPEGILSNAGRCDICGKTIDMRDDGDTLTISEFGVPDEVEQDHGVTDQEAADAVADALERVGDSGADYDLAETIREEHIIRVHSECLYEETAYGELETEPPADGRDLWEDGGDDDPR
jgi:hypothetical protein